MCDSYCLNGPKTADNRHVTFTVSPQSLSGTLPTLITTPYYDALLYALRVRRLCPKRRQNATQCGIYGQHTVEVGVDTLGSLTMSFNKTGEMQGLVLSNGKTRLHDKQMAAVSLMLLLARICDASDRMVHVEHRASHISSQSGERSPLCLILGAANDSLYALFMLKQCLCRTPNRTNDSGHRLKYDIVNLVRQPLAIVPPPSNAQLRSPKTRSCSLGQCAQKHDRERSAAKRTIKI